MSRDPVFPIIEVFGFPTDARTPESRDVQSKRHCPFADVQCEKFRQYGYGYCSVTYAAADDEGTRLTYAVCDHRLDGAPVAAAISDHFGARSNITLVPEIVLTNPRTSFDFVAFRSDDKKLEDVIAIETQAIDMRGGGVGPAWRAWMDGRPNEWRRYFTEEAEQKRRRDTVAYGVNMANIYKRLGLQVAEKGSYLKNLGVPLYVVMQDRPFQYLHRRIAFAPTAAAQDWDVAFMTFDYTGRVLKNGMLEFAADRVVRTTLQSYLDALSQDKRASNDAREHFLSVVRRKAGIA